jgi:drug/metabolite transporter (DMT)-like permease
MIDRNFFGNSAAFIAAVLFGASVVATRVAVGSIPPLSLAFLRFGQGGVILLISLLIFRPGLLIPAAFVEGLFQAMTKIVTEPLPDTSS